MNTKNLLFRFYSGVISTLEEILALIVCMILYPFRSSKIRKSNADPEKLGILCVHGYIHNESPWGFFRRYLLKHGAGDVNTVYYHSLTKDILTNSAMVKERIKQVEQETGREVSVLIGHSLGGLVSLEYALTYAPKDRMITIITMGSPLHGSKIHFLGMGPSVKQMKWHGKYVEDLHERLKEAKHIRLLNIGSNSDNIIIPRSSALLPDIPYAQNVMLDNLGHLAFLFSKRTLKIIVEFLNDGKK